jgi:hypothetical protein
MAIRPPRVRQPRLRTSLKAIDIPPNKLQPLPRHHPLLNQPYLPNPQTTTPPQCLDLPQPSPATRIMRPKPVHHPFPSQKSQSQGLVSTGFVPIVKSGNFPS